MPPAPAVRRTRRAPGGLAPRRGRALMIPPGRGDVQVHNLQSPDSMKCQLTGQTAKPSVVGIRLGPPVP